MEEKEEDSLKKILWELGLTDGQIASVFNVDIDIISDWRTNLGLDRNQIGVESNLNKENDENKLKKALWELGLTDQQLANIFLVSKSTISYWRKKNGLQCNDKRNEPRLEKKDLELRLKLINQNYSDEEIAIATGLSKGTITSWRFHNNLFKDKTNSEKIEELSEKESMFFEYLKAKYPERTDSFCIGLAKYVEPKVGIPPTTRQKEFIRKIKVAGFKTVHYFDNGEYNNLNEAMDLFIRSNPNIDEEISKIHSGGMNRELYKVFLEHRSLNKQSAQVEVDEKISTSIVLDPEPIKTIDNDPDMESTQINPDEKTSLLVALDHESIKIIDMGRGQQSRSAYINELIHTYGNGQDNKL